jgi:hypothetical protein
MTISSIAAALFSFLAAEPNFGANSASIFFAVLARTFTYGTYAVFVETGKNCFNSFIITSKILNSSFFLNVQSHFIVRR